MDILLPCNFCNLTTPTAKVEFCQNGYLKGFMVKTCYRCNKTSIAKPTETPVLSNPLDKGQGNYSHLEEIFHYQLSTLNLQFKREYKFHTKRGWKFDFAFPLKKIAIEIEGGTRQQGRHTRHEGYKEDCIKYNEGTILGWKILRFTYDMLESGEALQTTYTLLNLPSQTQRRVLRRKPSKS